MAKKIETKPPTRQQPDTRHKRLAGFIRRPRADEIRALLENEYIQCDAAELESICELVDGMLRMFDRLDELPLPELPLHYANRGRSWRPTDTEDPYNAFIRKCEVKGAPTGKLSGKRIGLKDNIRLAGVPMTNGSRLLQHFVPDVDATVVERLLDAGGTIVGKLNMDDFGFSGTSETSAFGCVRNPLAPEYSAGGSSGGCGAAVASGDVDIAIAVDQGGSARIPAAWCGVTTIKPTHGLVPSFGITYLEHTIDFVCPVGRTVKDVALALEVMAGDDLRDPQWVRTPLVTEEYSRKLGGGVAGLKIGIVAESMDVTSLENDVETAVRRAVAHLSDCGAECGTVSVGFWRDARAIWNGFAAHAITAMIESEQEGYGRRGFCDLGWQEAFANARRSNSGDFPPVMKLLMATGRYLRREGKSLYFSKATNLRYGAIQEMNRLFEVIDVLVTPTTPMKAFRLLDQRPSLKEMASRAGAMCENTYPLNVTGHPAVSVPIGTGEHGLPIGLQLVGPYMSESLLLRVAHALEEAFHGTTSGR